MCDIGQNDRRNQVFSIGTNYVSFDKSINEACNLVQKWLPPVTEQDKIILIETLTGTENTFGIPLLQKYIELLRPYTEILGISGKNKPREVDCVASGVVFFYGCLFYIMHFPGWGSHIINIFHYNLLYILVDHYIDDIKIDTNSKATAIDQMFILIRNPLAYQSMSLIDPVLKVIAITYNKLITNCPATKDCIIKLFEAEIEGLIIQKSNKFTREKYYDIATRKGGYTMQVLQHIVGNTDSTITKASFQIGEIMQIIDDSVDVLSDIGNGINTIATHDLYHEGNLDNLWIDIIHKINNIDKRFTIFKILYSIFAVYIPDRLPANYSKELRSKTNRMNLFDYNYGCDGSVLLVNAIMNELNSIEILENMFNRT